VKGLLGKAKIPVAILATILLTIFVVNFVLPSMAVGSSAIKDIYFVVKDSSGNPVQNAEIDFYVSEALDGSYNIESSVLTGSDGTAVISTSSSGYCYFVVSKLGYDSNWPDESLGQYSETAEEYVITISDITSSTENPIAVTLDVIPAIWTDKTDYRPEETVYIYGSSFDTNPVRLATSVKGSTVNQQDLNVVNGGFETNFQLDGITDTYTVTASYNSQVLATTTFVDYPATTCVNIIPSDDAAVRLDHSNNNYGSEDTIHTKHQAKEGTDDDRRSYLKFNLSSIPAGATITSATLRLYKENDDDSGSRTVYVYNVSDDTWTEGTVTWNNGPSYSNLCGSTGVGNTKTYYNWSVTSCVQGEFLGNKIISLLAKVDESGSTYRHRDFDSKEASGTSKDPKLEVCYESAVCGNGILEGNEECEKVGGIWPACCNNSTCMFKPAQTECRASGGVCDVAEYCTGSSADCPADAKAQLSTPCDNGIFCDGPDHCNGSGSCVNLGPSIDCNDQNICTIDICNETLKSCVHNLNDTEGPVTSNVLVNPSYNNGIFNVTALATDQCSNINTSEYFLRHGGSVNCGTHGTGTLMPAEDGNFDELIEDLRKNNVEYFEDGSNRICIQSQDVDNNWGNCACGYFESDTTPPELLYNFTLNHVSNPHELLVCGSNPLINVTICDSESNIQGGEYFLDKWIPPEQVPAPWSGLWLNILNNYVRQDGWHCSDLSAIVNLTPLSEGTHYINQIRGKDIVENWGKIYGQNFSYSFVKDITPPSTTKGVDNPKVECQITNDGEGNQVEQCWYIKQGTAIHLSAVDPNPGDDEYAGLDKIMCQFRWKNNTEDAWSVWSAPTECPNPIVFNEDSYHEIKYWAVDKCGNAEQPHYEIEIVDTQAPTVTKSIGEPKHACEEGENCDFYITGQTQITLDCVDQDPHPVDNVKIYYRYYLDGQQAPAFTEDSNHVVFTIPQDSNHTLEWYCVDALGNSDGTMQIPYHEVDIVDNKPPIVSKDVGTPKVESTEITQYQVPDTYDVKDTAWFITQNTEITLSCQDDVPHPSDHVKIYYKYYVDGVLHTDWTEYTGTHIKYDEDTYHELYYYCEDVLGNKGPTHYELDIVDTQAPHTTKTIGDPKVEGTGDVDWWVTQQTSITLSCVDQGPHPVNDVTLYYRIYNDSILIQDWTLYTGAFHFTEDSEHRLEWYCEDALGNSEGSAEKPIVEIDQVDTAPPEIFKWVDDNTVQQGETVKICANVTDKKQTGDLGVGVAWVKAKLVLGDDPIYVDLINVEGNTYCGDWVVPQIKECYRCFGFHCEYRCVWELWVKSEDLLGNFNKTDGIEIIVDNADPKIEAVLWPSKDKYYRDGKEFEVKALAIDFGGDENILNSDNCKASGVKECRFYAIKYDFESVNQSEIKNLWDYLHWLEETTGEPIETVYLGSVPWENGYCKGSLQFPEDSVLNHEDILFLAYEIEDNSGNMNSGLAEDWDGDKITMKMDNEGPSVTITNGNLPGPFTTGDLVQVFAELKDIDSGPDDCWADLYLYDGEVYTDTGYNLNGYVANYICEISDSLPPGLETGYYQIVVTATDDEGNTGEDWNYLEVDNTPPVIELLKPEPEGTYDEEIPIEINITDEMSAIEDSTVQYRIFEPSAWYSGLLCLFGYCPYDSTWQTATWNITTETYQDMFNASELVEGKTYFLAIRGCDVLYDSMLFTDNTVDLYHCVME
jgi:hypothetical protein